MWWQSRRRRAPISKGHQNAYMAVVVMIGGAVLVAQMFWVKKNQYLFMPFSLDRVKCEECGGTGMIPKDDTPNSPLMLCPACFGVGSHQFRRVDKSDMLCPACEGMGRVPEADAWRTCRRCDGRGLIRAESAPSVSDFLYELQPSTYVTNEASSVAPPLPDQESLETDHGSRITDH